MKTHPFTILAAAVLFWVSGCTNSASKAEQDRQTAASLSLEWEVVSNREAEVPRCRTSLLIRNHGSATLDEKGWAIYYNQDAGDIIEESVTGNVQIENLGGDYIRLSPREGFLLPPGGEITIHADHQGWIIKEDQAPAGVYVVFSEGDGGERSRHALTDLTIGPFSRPEQLARFSYDQTPDPTPEWQFGQNNQLTKLDQAALPLVIPSPTRASLQGASATIGRTTVIRCDRDLESEALLLAGWLEAHLGTTVRCEEGAEPGKDIILLGLSNQISRAESYRMEVEANRGITITGGDPSGVFYGIQSLLSLVPLHHYKEGSGQISIPGCIIEDAPRFPYRGMHLDVSRNFNKKEAVFRLIDIMSFYKMNILHLHLTDDEGWRLEIPGLPELTGVGAFRGHTTDEKDYLHPSYGSGPEPDPSKGYGSGFYSRDDYIEILKYARDRHLEVIPEFDLPGHARAAIIAMDARYRYYMEQGEPERAEEYLLTDPEDRSEYSSAQKYNDNVICVCRKSVYRFIETVVDEVIGMYDEAGAPLATIHIGGDEVPQGAWEKSPLCSAFLQSQEEFAGADLMDYFLERTARILEERDLITSGWEEIVLKRNHLDEFTVTLPGAGNPLQVYIWDNFRTGNQDIGNRIANAGYPVVLCSVTNFYFELAYNKDPREPGHYWGGFTDTRTAYEYVPFDVFKSLHTTPMGRPYDPLTDFKDMERLDPGARDNILGLQGELWSEPIKGPEMLEYFYLPKMLGLAERAWSVQPRWAGIDDREQYGSAFLADWNIFANALGQRELPRLDVLFGGYNYRLPPPGLRRVDGVLHANTQFPGLPVRYTTDGTLPTVESDLYTGPVRVEGVVTASTFDSRGRSSRASVLKTE